MQALQRGPLGAGHARHLAQRVHRRARHARVRVAAQLAQRRHRRAHHLRACSFVILLCGAGELPSCAHRRAVSSGLHSTLSGSSRGRGKRACCTRRRDNSPALLHGRRAAPSSPDWCAHRAPPPGWRGRCGPAGQEVQSSPESAGAPSGRAGRGGAPGARAPAAAAGTARARRRARRRRRAARAPAALPAPRPAPAAAQPAPPSCPRSAPRPPGPARAAAPSAETLSRVSRVVRPGRRAHSPARRRSGASSSRQASTRRICSSEQKRPRKLPSRRAQAAVRSSQDRGHASASERLLSLQHKATQDMPGRARAASCLPTKDAVRLPAAFLICT